MQAQQVLEDQAARLAIVQQEKTSLAAQIDNLRAAMYVFWLFDDRYRCGVTDNPEKRKKQHRMSWPGSERATISIMYALQGWERQTIL